jgi:SAM-dependent methyltransferase
MRNFLYLPLSVIFIFSGLPLFFILICIPEKKFSKLIAKRRKAETRQRIDDIGKFIFAGDHVLDVGCGNGKFGEAIAKTYNVRVHGVDVVNYSNAGIPIDTYDGVRLPFPNNSFDVIVMAMMLHHSEYQEKLFDEVIRCSRRAFIIYEDTYFSPWQRLAITWNDFYSNMVIGLVKAAKGLEGKDVLGMPLPFTFRSVEGWHRFFAEKSLTQTKTIVRHMGLKPHSKVTFLLEKSNVSAG